jgi:hypothetical protein
MVPEKSIRWQILVRQEESAEWSIVARQIMITALAVAPLRGNYDDPGPVGKN